MRASAAPAMPAPWSVTSISIIAPARRARSRTSLARGENLAESPERRERRPELVRGDGDKSGLRAVQLFEMARGGRDPRLQLVGEPPGPRREPRVLQRDGDVGAERLERRALLVAELAGPLDGEHADRLTGHDERRGEHSARPPAAARVGH